MEESDLKSLFGRRYLLREKMLLFTIVASLLLISVLHYVTTGDAQALHNIYLEFYYIPVFLGAFLFGLKGGLVTFFAAFLLYLPYILISWTDSVVPEINRFLHLLLQGLFALGAGFLIDRDRQRRDQMEKDRYLAGIGQVATSIVHDLRNPLVTMLGFAKRIQDGKGNQDSNIQAVIDSAQGMERIVDDVLDFARPIRLELQQEDLRQVVDHACVVCKTKAEEGGVKVSRDQPPEPVRTVIDKFQMERAITNLLSNAIEASDRYQTVTISTKSSDNSVSVIIKDHGSGMDSETLENVFIPFYTKKSKGTGLGMSIAKKIIDGHLGTINIYSRPGEGTKVKIEIPHAVPPTGLRGN
ncbi:MAG: HAMP domain-containing histidine kinase [Nitrospirota bacterium]|nr:HAMP domain-containing histidine kinase [Nitrospirota bacterium]